MCVPLFFSEPMMALSFILVLGPILAAVIVGVAYVEQRLRPRFKSRDDSRDQSDFGDT